MKGDKQHQGYKYEEECCEYLKNNGFYNIISTKKSGDQGIDIIATKNGQKYGIQCKKYSNTVSNKAVQEAYAGARFYECDIAVVMTNSLFSQSAIELARKLDVKLWTSSTRDQKYKGDITPKNQVVLKGAVKNNTNYKYLNEWNRLYSYDCEVVDNKNIPYSNSDIIVDNGIKSSIEWNKPLIKSIGITLLIICIIFYFLIIAYILC